MKDLEFNKMAAAVLLGGIVAMVTGYAAQGLYQPVTDPEKRGFQIEGAEEAAGAGAEPEEEKPLDIGLLMAAADAESGAKVFKKCTSCHTIEQGDPHKVGPNLYNIVGVTMGQKPDFAYSDAMKEKGAVWDYEALFAFLNRPKDYLPGTKMAYAGLRKPEQKADLIAYMAKYSTNPPPLPEPLPEPVQEAAPAEPSAAEEDMNEEAPPVLPPLEE